MEKEEENNTLKEAELLPEPPAALAAHQAAPGQGPGLSTTPIMVSRKSQPHTSHPQSSLQQNSHPAPAEDLENWQLSKAVTFQPGQSGSAAL